MGVRMIPDMCERIASGIVVVDRNYVVEDVNYEIVRKSGLSKEDIIGRSFIEFVNPDDAPLVRERIERAFGGSVERLIVRLTSPAVKDYWVYLRFTKYEEHMVISMIDVNAMVEANNKLKEKNQELETIYEFLTEVGKALDIEEIYTLIYRQFSKVLVNMDAFTISIVDYENNVIRVEYVIGEGRRYPAHEIPFNDVDTLTGWVALHRKLLYIRDLESEETPSQFRLVGEHMRSWLGVPLMYRGDLIGVLTVQSKLPNAFSQRDFDLLHLLSSNLAMHIANGILYTNLKRSEERYRTLVTTSLVGFVYTDENDRITFVNDAMAEMLGYRPKELLGKDPLEFTTPHGAEMIKKGRERRRRGISDTYEAELRRKDGSIIYVLIYSGPIKDEKGNFVGTMSAVADITPIKNLERKLRESKQLQELLLHILSHDIKTPLSVILGYTELLRDDCNEEYISEISHAVEQILTMIKNIRMISKLDMGKIEEGKEQYSITKVIQESIDIVSKSHPECEFKLVDDEVSLEGYSALMQEALTNIMSNACKYGAHRVVVSIEAKDGKALIKIADDGPGIPDEIKEKIFEPFVKYGTEGSGLGLSIVKRVVELHGGKIWVEDNKPHGSVFIISLPIKSE
ncbi:MAG: PAS domain S-box protein [Euryarchaeota archaeon]|nr:PAS domain S-box protein [Euryarchaeota archaeon]